MKIWTSDEKNDDKIIVYSNETIYKANPPSSKVEACVSDLKMQQAPSKEFFGVPLRYISEINLQEGKKYIEIIFRGDQEHLKVKDDIIRHEMFEFFKQNIPGATHSHITQSTLQSVKKPLIATAVICVIFLWSLYIAKGMEDGNQYDVSGQRYHSMAGIVLAIASLGVNKVLLIFAALLLITSISFAKKYKNPIVKNVLVIKH